jgi:ArsR family transcriptional regulator
MITPQEFFSLLSDETRLRCLLLLQREKELCVCELSHALSSIQPKISRHLAHLRKSGLVLDERRGQWVYYRLSEKLETWMKQVLTSALKELQSMEPHRSDFEKIKEMRTKNCCSS